MNDSEEEYEDESSEVRKKLLYLGEDQEL